MRSTPGPEPVTEPEEVFLVDRVQHRRRRPLDDLVLQRGTRVLSRELRLLAGPLFRGCRYSLMFRPPSLLSPQIVPTAAHTAAGQPGILRPGLSCFVTSTRTGYANRLNTGN